MLGMLWRRISMDEYMRETIILLEISPNKNAKDNNKDALDMDDVRGREWTPSVKEKEIMN